jgi:hypothetical protein
MKILNFSTLRLALLSLLLLGFSANLHAQDPEPIGLMLSTVGVVSAEDADGNVRRLQRRSPVFEGDTLITANRARAQIRFNDRGLVALQPNTSFFIEEHNFEGQEDGTESAVYSLLRGGLQAITGLIGRTNRDKYQVSTPIATIGLRGTHWAATFCTTACDGNAPGLYGGVADGGIDVCNGGGCTAVETNSYFYTPDANTAAETLLAPPSVVFAAADEDEEEGEEGEAGEVAETDGTDEGEGGAAGDDGTTGGGDAGDGDGGEAEAEPAVANVAAFVQRIAENQGVTAAEVIQRAADAGRLDDLAEAAAQAVADARVEEVTEDIGADLPTTIAPLGSVAVLATARDLSASQTGALDILLYPSGTEFTPAATTIDVDGETALAGLRFDLQGANCDPCLFATGGLFETSAELVESIETTVDGVDIFLGRWAGTAQLQRNGASLNPLENHHYGLAIVDGGLAHPLSLSANAANGTDVVGKFSLLNATAPTDASGTAGTLDRADLYLDFFEQVVTAIELDISFADEREIFADLRSPFQLANVGGLFAPLVGGCFGGDCGQGTEVFGDTSFSFIGPSAEHILGGYALDTEALDMSIFGAYLLGQAELIEPEPEPAPPVEPPVEPPVVNPPGYVLDPDVTLSEGGVVAVAITGISDGKFAPLGTVSDIEDTDIGLISLEGKNHVVIGIQDLEEEDYSEGGVTGPSTNEVEPDEEGSFIITEGILAEYSTVSNDAFSASLGRWNLLQSELFIDGSVRSTTSDAHFVYSEDPTDFDVEGIFDSLDLAAPILSYSLLDATAPTDQDGNLGVLNSLEIEINLLAQLVTDFSLDIDIGDTFYEAGLYGTGVFSEDDEIRLIGACSGGDCGNGQSIFGVASLGFVGEQAQGILGHYGLSSFDGDGEPPFIDEDDENDNFEDHHFSDISVVGVYVAGRDSAIEAPVNLFPSADMPAMAKFSSVEDYSFAADDTGMAGEVFASMELDLYSQTLERFDVEIEIGDRYYYAESTGFDDYYYYYPKTGPITSNVASPPSGSSSGYGISFDQLLEGYLELDGFCEGGDCSTGGYDTSIYGYAMLSPFGSAGEGFFSEFELSDCFVEDECWPLLGIELSGEAILAQYEMFPHIGWQIDPVGIAASAPAVAAISGNLVHDTDPVHFHSFAGVLNPAAGDSFTTISIEDQSYIVDSVQSGDIECDICTFEVENAVVIEVGDVFHEYQYLNHESNGVSWAAWRNNDSEDGWLQDGVGVALPSTEYISTLYSHYLSQTLPAYALTGNDDYAYYEYAGGPAPVNEMSEFGYVDEMQVKIDFFDQELENFYTYIEFGGYGDSDYRDYYLWQNSAVDLAQVMEIELTGTCNGDGCGSSGDDTLDGEASFALVGEDGEQLLGALAAWSDGLTAPHFMGQYSIETGFVLNQEFDETWVISDPFRVDTNQSTYLAHAPIFAVSPGAQWVPVPSLLEDDDPNEGDIGINLTNHQVDTWYTNVHYLGFNELEVYSELDNSRYIGADIFAGYDIFSASEYFNIEEGSLTDIGFIEGQYPVDWYDPSTSSNHYVAYDPESSGFYREPAFFVDWGLWETQDVDQNLTCCGLADANELLYQPWAIAYQDSITDAANLVALTHPAGSFESIGTYHYLGGPQPYGPNGLGSITGIRMDWDFQNNSLYDFWIKATDSGDTFFAEYDDDTGAIYPGDATVGVPLNGNCLGCDMFGYDVPVSGDSYFTFLGENAEGALGSFGLVDSGQVHSVAGVYVLEQELNDHWVIDPITDSAATGGIVSFAATESGSYDPLVIGFNIDESNTAELTNVVSFDHNHPNALAGFSVTDSDLPDCGTSCSWSVLEGELYTYDNSNAPAYDYLPDAYWGRWETQDDIDVEGVMVALRDFKHWAYSPDPTDLSAANPIWGSGATVHSYSYVDGTSVTDLFGGEDSNGLNDFAMSVDFQTQMITEFTFDATLDNGWSFSPDMATDTPLGAGYIDLSTIYGAYDGESTYNLIGGTTIQMIGSGAEAAIGAFGISAEMSGSIYNTATGAFMASDDSLPVP